jgi:rubrerythrin
LIVNWVSVYLLLLLPLGNERNTPGTVKYCRIFWIDDSVILHGGIAMSNRFNADEIFKMAIELERQGVLFYSEASRIFDDPQLKNMLEGLASMEAEHERVFSSMRDRLVGQEFYSDVFDPDNLSVSYLQAMTHRVVFDTEYTFSGSETISEILKKGIEAEKNSIVFYAGIKNIVPEKLGRDKVEKIIQEEMEHVVILNDKLSLLESQVKGEA